MNKGRTSNRWLDLYSYENEPSPKITYQKNIENKYISIYVSSQNSATGGTSEMAVVPDPKFIDLAFNVFNQEEKEEFLRELLQASMTSVQTGNTENIQKILLAWEYTALWKKDPDMLEKLSEEDTSEPGIDWREFLTSEGV